MNEFRQQLYDEWRNTHGDDPAKAVGWRNKEALDARFKCTLDHLSHKNFDGVSILDVGCGASLNLLRYLPDADFSYIGIDCNHESLEYASKRWMIPYNDEVMSVKRQLIKDEYLDKVRDTFGFDIIIAQGIYQEFDRVRDVRDHVYRLSTLLAPGGELLIMTPCNRTLDAEGKSVLKLSAYDAVGALEDTGLPYELSLGELGEHLIMKCWRKDDDRR